MKISMLSKSDESGGGASRVAENLSQLLVKNNDFIVTKFAKTANKNYIDIRGSGLNKLLYKASRFISRTIGLPDILTTEYLNLKKTELVSSNIFHIHDISSAISPITIKKLASIAPVVWTIHDCSPFTGGCIYPLSCTKYINNNCSNCPQLKDWPLSTRFDHTGYMQSLKIDLINNHISKIICPSQWIAQLAISAGVSKHLITIIYNSVDTDLFYPEKIQEKERLCILISSVDLENKFKGCGYSIDIINNLKLSADLLVVGKNGEDFKRKIDARHNVTIMNQTFDSELLASYYRRADILLHTSIADNCPLTILESLASGVPVITFRTGGIPELIQHNVNGWITEPGNTKDAVTIIEQLAENRELLNSWKKNSTNTAAEKFNTHHFLKEHVKLYREIVNAKRI